MRFVADVLMLYGRGGWTWKRDVWRKVSTFIGKESDCSHLRLPILSLFGIIDNSLVLVQV